MADRAVVFVTRRPPEAVVQRLERDHRPRVAPDDRALGPDDLIAGAAGADAVLTFPGQRWTAEVIEALSGRTRIIATFSVGFEHIDLGAAKARGIVVSNTPDVLSEATADTAVLCLLGAARRAFEGERMMRDGSWAGWGPRQLLGLEMNGSTLGIVGMGRIGQAVARRARGFGMTVRYHNRRRLDPSEERGAIFHDELDSMLPLCRFLSLNCPSTPETKGMIDGRALDLMPDDSVVVNTARGDLIDDEALIARLKDGRIFAAGLDVFAGEPAIHPAYRDLPNVFLLPHLGSATVETRNRMGFRCLDNIDAVLAGRPAPDALG